MAEIAFNQAYENLTDAQKRQFDGVMGMGGFNERYQANPESTLVTSDPDYAAFAPISKAYQESETVNDGFNWGSLLGMGSADASEMPQNKYGLQTNTMGGVTLNPDGSLNYNNQSPNLGFRSMVDMAADTNNFMDQFQTPQAANRYSGMGQVGPNKSDMIGNTIAEAMIDEDRIPGRVQESVPNYQNWFERMMSGAQDKLGGAWGKTKDLGSRFKEGARPVWGLASMIGNATNPLNPKSFNYNPNLKGQLDFMDKEMGGWSTNNPSSGLMQYSDKVMLDGELVNNPLRGQNVMSIFGSNDPITQLEKQMARHQKTIDKIPDQWSKLSEKDLAAKIAIHLKRFNDTQAWHTQLMDKRKAKQAAAAKVAQAAHDAQMARSGITVSSGGYQGGDGGRGRGGQGAFKEDTRSMRSAGRTYTDARGNKGYSRGRRDGGRVGYGNGGLATLFTRRG